MEPPIDIVTSDYEFDSQSDLVFPGTWYQAGVTDGLNGFDKRSLEHPFDVFQDVYEEGFDHGEYNRTYLVDPRP